MNLTGAVIAGLEPVVTLRILGEKGQSWEVDAVVDTGFTGTLILPANAVKEMRLPWVGEGAGMVIDGAAAEFDVYRAKIVWVDGPLIVEIIELGGFALIGMTLLQGTRLTMDVTDGGDVRIAPLSSSSDDD